MCVDERWMMVNKQQRVLAKIHKKKLHKHLIIHVVVHHSRIRTGRQQVTGESIHIDIPNGPLVSCKGTDSFTILRSPHAGYLILGGGKEQVSVGIELDDCDGSFVAL